MQQYRIPKNRIRLISRRIALIFAIVFFIVITGAFASAYFEDIYEEGTINVMSYVSSIVVAIAMFSIAIYFIVLRMKKWFNNYSIVITNNTISRYKGETPVCTMYFNEVSKITKYRNGSFLIMGKNKSNIIVQQKMENAENLETVLNRIMPVSSPGKGDYKDLTF